MSSGVVRCGSRSACSKNTDTKDVDHEKYGTDDRSRRVISLHDCRRCPNRSRMLSSFDSSPLPKQHHCRRKANKKQREEQIQEKFASRQNWHCGY